MLKPTNHATGIFYSDTVVDICRSIFTQRTSASRTNPYSIHKTSHHCRAGKMDPLDEKFKEWLTGGKSNVTFKVIWRDGNMYYEMCEPENQESNRNNYVNYGTPMNHTISSKLEADLHESLESQHNRSQDFSFPCSNWGKSFVCDSVFTSVRESSQAHRPNNSLQCSFCAEKFSSKTLWEQQDSPTNSGQSTFTGSGSSGACSCTCCPSSNKTWPPTASGTLPPEYYSIPDCSYCTDCGKSIATIVGIVRCESCEAQVSHAAQMAEMVARQRVSRPRQKATKPKRRQVQQPASRRRRTNQRENEDSSLDMDLEPETVLQVPVVPELLEEEGGTVSCPICHRTYKGKHTMLRHMNMHTGKFKCDVCGKTFSMKSGLEEHMFIHGDKKPFTCEHCGKSFRFRSNWRSHVDQHEGKYKCDVCGKLFGSKQNALEHGFMHKNLRPYECGECGKSFTYKRVLAKHKQLLNHT